MGEEYKYDCTIDVLAHKRVVEFIIAWVMDELNIRSAKHDLSKLSDPLEKETFDLWTPRLRGMEFGSDEYEKSLKDMGPGVRQHYVNNRHHPEHFENGIDDMTLVDLIEMFSDWYAVSIGKDVPMDLKTAQERFGMSPQLVKIFQNTHDEMERHYYGRSDT